MKKKSLIIGVFLLLVLPSVYAAAICPTCLWGDASTIFTTTTSDYYCSGPDAAGSYWWIKLNPAGGTTTSNTSDIGCNQAVVAEGSAHSCCTEGDSYSCEASSDLDAVDGYKCLPPGKFSGCAQYQTPDACMSYTKGVAVTDVENKVAGSIYGVPDFCRYGYTQTSGPYTGCTYLPNCKCMWDEGTCAAAYPWVNVTGCPTSDCYMPSVNDTGCVDGARTIGWDWYYKNASGKIMCANDLDCANIVGVDSPKCDIATGKCISNSCRGGSRQQRCLTSNLGFFSEFNILIAASMIFAFYLFSKKLKVL